MSLNTDLLARVLHLPVSERAELARRILLSLEPVDFDADAEQLWAVEIEARLAALDRGESVPMDWRPAIDRIRQSLTQGPRP
jgi:putative addiction module component (TIGR02574 family)